jgi:hypothetical protein
MDTVARAAPPPHPPHTHSHTHTYTHTNTHIHTHAHALKNYTHLVQRHLESPALMVYILACDGHAVHVEQEEGTCTRV